MVRYPPVHYGEVEKKALKAANLNRLFLYRFFSKFLTFSIGLSELPINLEIIKISKN